MLTRAQCVVMQCIYCTCLCFKDTHCKFAVDQFILVHEWTGLHQDLNTAEVLQSGDWLNEVWKETGGTGKQPDHSPEPGIKRERLLPVNRLGVCCMTVFIGFVVKIG